MAVPRVISSRGIGYKLTAVVVIAVLSMAGLLAGIVPPFNVAVDIADTAFYDAFYKLRTPESRRDGSVVIVQVDQSSIEGMAAQENRYRWPWPREYWGLVLQYLEQCGARAAAIDLLMEEPSGYNRDTADDTNFAAALDTLKLPVVFAAQMKRHDPPLFAPPVKRPPTFGAADVIDSATIREYDMSTNGRPSLALAAVRAAGISIPDAPSGTAKLYFYGPSRRRDGRTTFRTVSAFNVILKALDAPGAPESITPDLFRDKIVLIGLTAPGTFDLKNAPVNRNYPGVESHATAIDNLLLGSRVHTLAPWANPAVWVSSLLAAAGTTLSRRMWIKLAASLLAILLLQGAALALFRLHGTLIWTPPTTQLLCVCLAILGGLGWTYFIEDRDRRILLRFLSQYVSPHVADELSRRGELSLAGERREMTVMFSDIEGFTTLADQMPADRLEAFMSLYLGEMSNAVFEFDATLDKYIGDALMCFWNAPLDQPDHATRACDAALRMIQRERDLQADFAQMGIPKLRTRVGINVGTMLVGNVGSRQKVNYTVVGDAVNLASRLEGANKIFGSQILVADAAKTQVDDRFAFRRLGALRARGKAEPVIIHELLGRGSERLAALAQQFEKASGAYESRDWPLAERFLVELLATFPDDLPSVKLLERVRKLQANPPAHWTAVFES
jgi:adenylate cyclase